MENDQFVSDGQGRTIRKQGEGGRQKSQKSGDLRGTPGPGGDQKDPMISQKFSRHHVVIYCPAHIFSEASVPLDRTKSNSLQGMTCRSVGVPNLGNLDGPDLVWVPDWLESRVGRGT